MNSFFYEQVAKERIAQWQREAALTRLARQVRRGRAMGKKQIPRGREGSMALYMDVHHKLPEGATAADVASAHEADIAIQQRYGVVYRNYWVDPVAGRVFCLVEAPSKEAASTVHREAHGLLADELFEVVQG